MSYFIVRTITIGVFVASTVNLPSAQSTVAIKNALSGEVGDPSPEVSTEELERILDGHTAIVLDARPFMEFAVSHIPGALNVAPKAGVPMSMYISDIAEIGRLVPSKNAALVLYCNGMNCGKSKRLAAELREAGFTNVRRYQLGIPVWRAVGGVCEVELDGLRYILSKDATSVIIDTREALAFTTGSLPTARNIPRSLVVDAKDMGEVRRAKDDGRLPMEDHNTRIIVIGSDTASTRFVAERITAEGFHNVSFFPGSVDAIRAVVK